MGMVGKENKKKLQIKWKTNKPAPDRVFEFVTCNCKKSRSGPNKYQCFSNKMKGTDLCNCKSCSNVYTDEDIETTK